MKKQETGNDYRKRCGKVAVAVLVTPAQRKALRIAAARGGFRGVAPYLLAKGLEAAP